MSHEQVIRLPPTWYVFDIRLTFSSISLRLSAVEEISTGSDSDYSRWVSSHCSLPILLVNRTELTLDTDSSWISWFLSSKGNEYFCEVEEDYILDRFNLTGLNAEVSNYTQALDLITDNLGRFMCRS